MSKTLLPKSEKLYYMKPLEAVQFRELWKVMDDLQTGMITLDQAIDAVRATVPGIPVTGTTKGDIVVWDGTGWVLLAAGADRDILGADSTSASGLAYYSPSDVVAQGLAVSDTPTIDLTLTVATLSAAAILQMSLTSDASGIKLVNDELAPGNSEYYGTDGAGVKGYFPLPASPGTDLAIANRTATTLDVTSSSGTDATVPEASITEAGLLIATDKAKLNNTSGTNSGDVTLAGENYITIAGQVITAAAVNLSGTNVTGDLPFTKIQQISTDRLLGRDTAGSGDIEEISLGEGLSWSGSQTILTKSSYISAYSGSVNSTNTVSEEILWSQVITANTLITGDAITLTHGHNRTAGAGTTRVRVRLHTSAAIAGSLFFDLTMTGTTKRMLQCNIHMAGASSQVGSPATGITWDQFGVSFGSAALSLASDMYIMITSEKSVGTDSSNIQFAFLEIKKYRT